MNLHLRLRAIYGSASRGVAQRCMLAISVLLLAACATVDLNVPSPPAARPTPAAPTVVAAAAPSLGFFSRIKAPETHEAVLRLTGRGVQVFRCERLSTGSGFAWVFRLPEADLTDSGGNVVGRHGANFSFEHSDGSRLLGNVVAYDEAPNANDLRWLLLSAKPFGQGVLSAMTHVQRINTQGGMPPQKCEAKQQNQLLRVYFSADFVFYKPR